MGRYPFLALANKYLETYGTGYAESTRKELERRYARMNKIFLALKESGKIESTSPEKLSADDILAYVNYLKKGKLKESGILHNLGPLNNLLAYAGNPAVTNYKQKYRNIVPKKRVIRYPSLTAEQIDLITQHSMKIDDNDWRRLQAYTLVILAISTGLRNKEIRLCNITDLDTRRWIIRAEHVKGEESYGEPRPIAIRPQAIEILKKYLSLRNKKVMEKCPNNLALFPALRDKEDGYFSSNGVRMLKTIVEKDTGLKFDLRACRRSYGQLLIDEGADLDSVSVLMGHLTTKTTETYYCRKQAETAIREAQSIWNYAECDPDAKKTKIDFEKLMTGYG